MSIKITIGKEQVARTKAKLNIRKSIDGNLMIQDHDIVDVVIMPEKSKVLVVAKEMIDDSVYDVANRLLRHLAKLGVIQLDSIRAGNIYGSLEATIPQGDDGVNAIDLTILVIARWMEKEKPHIEFKDAAEEEMTDNLTDPNDKKSTDQGEIEHPTKKITNVATPSVRGLQAPFE